MDIDKDQVTEEFQNASKKIVQLQEEMAKVVVGQSRMVQTIVRGLLTGGHVLLEGLPGLAKSLTISTLAGVVDLDYKRVQFTPDLLPSDLIGTMIFNPKTAEFAVKKGPIFTNIVLADEINRAPAKVQSALLECMAEKQVTIGETSYKLDEPFLVLATQNPIEQEGTYPLPEAQLDRFMFKYVVEYPSLENEKKILEQVSTGQSHQVQPVLTQSEILKIRGLINSVFLEESLKDYILKIVFASRNPTEYGLPELAPLIRVGASPRATINLAKAARAEAVLNGRSFVMADDIKKIAMDVIRHRLLLSFEAEAENTNADEIVSQILNKMEIT